MALARQIEELVLLKCSLFPDEILEFVLAQEDFERWTQVVNAYSEGGDPSPSRVSCPAHFNVKIRDVPIWFEINFSDEYPLDTTDFDVIVRGYNLSQAEQQRWHDVISRSRAQMCGAAFFAYELISLQLLPLLREEYDQSKRSAREPTASDSISTANIEPRSEPVFHALVTSHHLKSPQKCRALQQWSSELCLCGFAKVGHPGLIYCSGLELDVKQFISKVKEMQWLALRVRFVEVLPDTIVSQTQRRGSWREVKKVGEVVDEMRKLGREKYVLNLGIGSARSDK